MPITTLRRVQSLDFNRNIPLQLGPSGRKAGMEYGPEHLLISILGIFFEILLKQGQGVILKRRAIEFGAV